MPLIAPVVKPSLQVVSWCIFVMVPLLSFTAGIIIDLLAALIVKTNIPKLFGSTSDPHGRVEAKSADQTEEDE
jgi:hypothetical protein